MISIQFFGGRGGGGSGGARGGRAGGSSKSKEVTLNGVSLGLGNSTGTGTAQERAEKAFRSGDLSIAADSEKEAVQKFNKALNNPNGGGLKIVRDKYGFTYTVYASYKGKIIKLDRYPDIWVEYDSKAKGYTFKQHRWG